MKENIKDDETHSSKNLLEKISNKDTIKSDIYIELEDKNLTLTQNSSLRRDSQTSFTKALISKVQKEEEEEFLKKRMKERQKLISKVKSFSRKDYIVFFFILISCGLNFNYLFLPFVLISVIYFFAIESLSFKLMKLKYFLEIFTVGYASYLFLYKVIIYSLIKNKNESVLVNKKDYFIDLGICTLKDIDSLLYFFLNFFPELIIIAASGYGVLISFQSRLLKETDTLSKNINGVKLSKLILIIYLFFIAFTNFHFSYISLLYMISNQFVMLLNSFKFNDKTLKKVLKFIMHILNFIIGIQIVLINYLNIPSIQKAAEEYYKRRKNIKIYEYFTWEQIGINISSSDDLKNTEADTICVFLSHFS